MSALVDTSAKALLIGAPAVTRRIYVDHGESVPPLALQVLVAYADDPDRRINEVGDELALSDTSVSHALTLLVKSGLVETSRGETGRTRRRHLTADGRQAVERLVARARAARP
jgi:DNA-binding MarR family transcriptional regulator